MIQNSNNIYTLDYFCLKKSNNYTLAITKRNTYFVVEKLGSGSLSQKMFNINIFRLIF